MTGALSRWGSCQCLLSWDESLCCAGRLGGHPLSQLLDPVPCCCGGGSGDRGLCVCVCVEDRKHATCAVCHSLHSNPHALRGYITQLWLCISIEIGLWKCWNWIGQSTVTIGMTYGHQLQECKLAPARALVTLWHCHQDVCRSWYRWRRWWGRCLRHANEAVGSMEGERVVNNDIKLPCPFL